ncbi:MAG: YihA family ribosome biogenesis GTP-binding protein [Exiguobacterium sp.]|jgi:GTP-binding protein|uniref:Probable GTP-binding protein EngB n=2 Tax=Exiguobacterium TaxID=33986 RepID=ENGB_EXISA|nr:MULTISPECIES: ribosome biogenesis GTP-binding protein YihA/YsxC [Exiguobacterium]C4L4J3.1 RecName: Full=Probable GTP-binding protein EngB [Exiguobacterium sp. AT1b]MBR2076113.1 YihA family ribosome biogenesis GTP-binding protein [Exiguobacterium sp.]MCC9623333.1 ribosome biogenesis GTP-binding protein YihA/YsxC [Thalassospira sp. MA62]QLQ22447.1 MAG: YihA family ribosome biogenesis GTP-binding protein [Paracoccaceae bacterium]QPI66894.1 YihA family ribosome biogenesis GTP-binding protein [E
MKINKAEFVTSAVAPDHYPVHELPEVALAGRSNVGKSSFINKICQRKALARTSSKPGKTQTLNFFNINDEIMFVDVPGYGYAKVSKTEREKWGVMMEQYLTSQEALRGVVLLVDIRHDPTGDDVTMYNFLKHYEIPVIVVATKLDKIKKSQRQKHEAAVKRKLQFDPSDRFVAFSAETAEGKDEAWKAIYALITEGE